MKNVLVSGASIAGPALALLLGERGFRVTVVERAAEIRTGGYAVDVRGVALEVIERMGLRDRLRPFETDTLYNEVVDAEGRRFGRTSRGFGVIDPGDVEIHRGDLARILFDASRSGADYRFGDSIASLDQRAAGVDVRFESGREETFDLVIGADGIHSRTRALVFGREDEFSLDLGSCMTIFTAPNVLGLERGQLLFSAIGRVASVKSANEDADLKVSLFFKTDRGAFVPEDEASQRRLTEDAWRDAGWVWPRLIEAMHAAPDFYCDRTQQIRMERFTRDRVALVGDAAHAPSPLTGQGTSLALVSAYLLALELAAAHGDASIAFPRYESVLRPFALRNQDIAAKVAGGFAPRTPVELRLRTLAMRALPYLPGTGLMMSLAMRGVRTASRALALPTA
jgi:2-polyprenyl-6-methoxyphenol hydroxylase-like FAD-dependent oxidoreductase